MSERCKYLEAEAILVRMSSSKTMRIIWKMRNSIWMANRHITPKWRLFRTVELVSRVEFVRIQIQSSITISERNGE